LVYTIDFAVLSLRKIDHTLIGQCFKNGDCIYDSIANFFTTTEVNRYEIYDLYVSCNRTLFSKYHNQISCRTSPCEDIKLLSFISYCFKIPGLHSFSHADREPLQNNSNLQRITRCINSNYTAFLISLSACVKKSYSR